MDQRKVAAHLPHVVFVAAGQLYYVMGRRELSFLCLQLTEGITPLPEKCPE